MRNPFRYFNSSPEVIRLAVMMYIRYPLSLRQVEDLLFERGIDICHETVRFWWNRFGPMFAAEIRKQRRQKHRDYPQWRWHLDEGAPRRREGGAMSYLHVLTCSDPFVGPIGSEPTRKVRKCC
jgi:transposase-like protein